MKKYYVFYPRDFSNEYTVFRTEKEIEVDEHTHRITRKEAEHLCAEGRKAVREYRKNSANTYPFGMAQEVFDEDEQEFVKI